ncbi:MAG TPA: PTS sugar transporter subunit IIC [Pseudonocardiaceae bacterium]|jgi:mannose/fructose/N-acetylgalactosamine-specific phosphotransferase system component IIC|nr:PTS sugar transporter subunit IIC [Pseudonocardiaceae bacterium]
MLLTALVLTLWACFCIYDVLGPTLIYASRPLIAGTVAGLIIGDLTLGMAVGATLELAALGVYTYGGATIPDYTTGAIVGTALAHAAGGDFTHELAIGLGLGIPAALLLTALDPIGRFLPTFWIHRADIAAIQGRTREMTVLHWTAFIPWAAVRAVPTFLAVYYSGTVSTVEKHIPTWFSNGMGLVGAILPAVGFAMLLRLLPVARYWYMLLIGYVMFAYMNVGLVGIALFGIAIAFIFVTLKPSTSSGGSGGGAPPTDPTPASTPASQGEATTNV